MLFDSTVSERTSNVACSGSGCQDFGGEGGGIYNNSGDVDPREHDDVGKCGV